MSDQRGITLIEGLAILAIVALVLVLFTVALFGARREGRDIKRVSDIQSLRSSMAAVKIQFGSYADSGCTPGAVSSCQTGNLAAIMPTVGNFNDPRGQTLCSEDCTKSCQYAFTDDFDDNSYQVLFYLEKGVGDFPQKGCYSLSPQGIFLVR